MNWYCHRITGCISVTVIFLVSVSLATAIGQGLTPAAVQKSEQLQVYIGTYTGGDSRGIYRCKFNLGTGELSAPELAAETVNPSFLALHPDGRFLYAVNEVGDFQGKSSGAVSAFAIDAQTGDLSLINQQPTGGGAPCHLEVDPSGRNVLVANYSGGSVAVFPIREGGRLGKASAFVQHEGSSVNPRRQKGPHAHAINVDRNNRFACAADLGLDNVLVYRFDPEAGTLTPNDPPAVSVKPGAGPRHFGFHPKKDFAYVINEMASTVTAFEWDPDSGVLSILQSISTLPEGFTGNNSTAELQIHPSGKFLYGSNRGHDSIAVFAIDPSAGWLNLVEREPTLGKTPRNFNLDPTGRYLLAANQNSDSVVVFEIDPDTGGLTPTGHSIAVPAPVCIQFLR